MPYGASLLKYQSEDGRVARVGKPDASLETKAAAVCLDASCETDRLRRPASARIHHPRHLAPHSVPSSAGC
jgi:hypothetical protein